MSRSPDTPAVCGSIGDLLGGDNRYVYWHTARGYEQSGDLHSAEMAYKAAVMSADLLPLAGYKREFKEESARYDVDGYKPLSGLSRAQMCDIYAEVLSLPYTARIVLADFLFRKGLLVAALQICQSALELPCDELLADEPHFVHMRQLGEDMYRRLWVEPNEGLSTTLKAPKVEDQQTTGTNILPDISQLWDEHMKSAGMCQAQVLKQIGDSEPLSCDSDTLIGYAFHCLSNFVENLPVDQVQRLKIAITDPHEQNENHLRRCRVRVATALWCMSIRADERFKIGSLVASQCNPAGFASTRISGTLRHRQAVVRSARLPGNCVFGGKPARLC